MTNPPPPPLDLEELKRLAKECPRPEWEIVDGIICDGGVSVCACTYNPRWLGDRQKASTRTELIVAAVNSLPALIAIAEEVERLRAENARLREEILFMDNEYVCGH